MENDPVKRVLDSMLLSHFSHGYILNNYGILAVSDPKGLVEGIKVEYVQGRKIQ